jgi:ribonuclease HI/exonuclease III
MQYVSWNCRGLGGKIKEEALRDIVRLERPEVLLIQETKMEDADLLRLSPSFWKKGPGIAVSARGASGGLATFWDSTKLEITEETSTMHWLFTNLIHKGTGRQVSLFNMYVPVLPNEKKDCWDSLLLFLNSHYTENLVIAGDLNVTLSLTEKKGGSIVRDPFREVVEDLMADWELEDIPPSNGKFSWTNKRVGPGHIAARLDRFLIQSSFLTLGLRASSKFLPHYTSDHKPIALSIRPCASLGPIPFKFSPLWPAQKDFVILVQRSWETPVNGSPFFVWEEKLRRLKASLKLWAKQQASPLEERRRAQDKLELHQQVMEAVPITQSLLKQEAENQSNLHKTCRVEEVYWRMKSRALWLQDGDKNTAFFHKHAQSRANYNSIEEIHWQEQVFNDAHSIKEVAHNYFKDLYSADPMDQLDPLAYPISEVPSLITEEDNIMLNRPITDKEIKKAVFRMHPDKAPGPDGFTVRFLTQCWDIIQKELCKMVRKSQDCNKLGGSTNSSFLALIPKEKGAKSFNRFRPISLCNTGYKIITKIIANRLKKILPKLIPENQGGFVHGRQILDNIILVQEAIHTSSKKSEKGMVVKLDLASAFDRVRHDFLLTVMGKFGFTQKFIGWIKACIAAPWIAPLINGRPTKFFQASRGLRQGCPMSPMLYVIQAAVLSYQFQSCLLNRSLPGIRITSSTKELSHAQFADDTLLLGAASTKTASSFKTELDIYTNCSGSEINYNKCKIYGWNNTFQEMQNIGRILNMESLSLWDNFTYLGIPIFKGRALVAHWMPMVDKLQKKIQAWGANWLNRAGKVVLMNSVLSSLPIYQCSVLFAPKTITNRIDALLRRFLWEGGKNNAKKLHLISWPKVKLPKLEGGLNIRDVAAHNLAMGCKLLWQMITGKRTWSKQVLRKKYFRGDRDRCLERPPKGTKGSPIFLLCLRALSLFQANLTWIPGNGAKIRILEDSILGEPPLKGFRDIQNIGEWLSANNFKTLWDISLWNNDPHLSWQRWNLGHYPEELKEEAAVLLEYLQGKAPVGANLKDKRGWGTPTMNYTAGAGYKTALNLPWVPPHPGRWQALWNFPSIPKVDHFAWTLTHNCILTFSNLKKRGWEGPSRCPLCRANEENTEHLLLECGYSREVWSLLLGNALPRLPSLASDFLINWKSLSPFDLHKKHLLTTVWMWLPKFISWKIWLERNNRVFNEVCRLPSQVAIQARTLIVEAITGKNNLINSAPLSEEESSWLNQFSYSTPGTIKPSLTPTRRWEVRLEEQEFLLWRSSLKDWCLFFDGASKGNPGQAGCGGVIIDPSGNTHSSYAWGIGYATNNYAEFLALWQGLYQALHLGIQNLRIFGDSKQVLEAIILKKKPKDCSLAQLYRKSVILLSQFRGSHCYHVLRSLNGQADAQANLGAHLSKGTLTVNAETSCQAFP